MSIFLKKLSGVSSRASEILIKNVSTAKAAETCRDKEFGVYNGILHRIPKVVDTFRIFEKSLFFS